MGIDETPNDQPITIEYLKEHFQLIGKTKDYGFPGPSGMCWNCKSENTSSRNATPWCSVLICHDCKRIMHRVHADRMGGNHTEFVDHFKE